MSDELRKAVKDVLECLSRLPPSAWTPETAHILGGAMHTLRAALTLERLKSEPTDEQIEAVFKRHNIPLPRVSSERPEDQRSISIMNLMFRQLYLDAARELVKFGRES